MKRIVSIVLCSLLLLGMCVGVTQAEVIVKITDAASLALVAADGAAHYELQNDITLTAADYAAGGAFYNGGAGFLPFFAGQDDSVGFTGVFDGKGHTIKGLVINTALRSETDSPYVGMFGVVKGTVRSLRLADLSVNFTIDDEPKEFSVVRVDVGGIVGLLSGGTVEKCMVEGTVKATVSMGRGDVGGVVGTNYGTVNDCASAAAINVLAPSRSYGGGVIGYNHGALARCWSRATITSATKSGTNAYAGRAVGYNQNGTMEGCYYLPGAGGIGYGTDVTATALTLPTDAGKASGLNFETVWTLQDGEPTLRDFVCNHSWGSGVITTVPTCGADGVKTYTCALCGATKTEKINATGAHKWDAGKVTKEPTTTATGIKTYTCTVCGDTKTEILPKKEGGEDTALIFKDVKKNDWFYKNGAINYVYNAGLFGGTTPTTFEPNTNMTRGMFVTVLGRLAGVSSKGAATKFVDVKKSAYYSGYVKWASDKGIVSGTSATKFEPDANVTREQICKMMTEYCKAMGITLVKSKPEIKFADAAKISKWARDYVKTCQMAGLVNGKENNRFDPQGNATRAEVATILYNFNQNYGK